MDSSNAVGAIAHPVPQSPQTSLRLSIIGFYIVAVLFNLCLVVQVMTVGFAYFDHPAWWGTHVWLARSYSGLSLILLVWAYQAPFSRRIRLLSLSLPILLGLQFLTMYAQLPLPIPVTAFHPLIGFSLFSASTTLVHRVGYLLRPALNDNASIHQATEESA